MSKSSDRNITMQALKYSGIRVLALVLMIALNAIFVFKLGWDIRNWQWWAIIPALSLSLGIAAAYLTRNL